MNRALWFHWSVCVVMAVFYAFAGDESAECAFVAAGMVILAIGDKK